MKVFVLGRPGCGKSYAVHRIEKLARRKELDMSHVNDYAILHEMFRADREHKQFLRTEEYDGFDVIDFSVMDTALKNAEQQAKRRLRSSDLVVIEFARNDYYAALKQFSKAFLKDAYFLFIDTDVETCIQRIRNRVKHPTTADDCFVSEHILECYYKEQRIPDLKAEYGIAEKQMKIVLNRGKRHDFDMQINRFFNTALQREHHKERFQIRRIIFNRARSLKSSINTLPRSLHVLTHKSEPTFEYEHSSASLLPSKR